MTACPAKVAKDLLVKIALELIHNTVSAKFSFLFYLPEVPKNTQADQQLEL
jgi:hypothetical protein